MIKALTLLLCSALTASNLYYSTLFVVVDTKPNEVVFEDCNGEVFALDTDPEDIQVGEYYSALMYNNGTAEIFDDQIVSVRYERLDLFKGGIR